MPDSSRLFVPPHSEHFVKAQDQTLPCSKAQAQDVLCAKAMLRTTILSKRAALSPSEVVQLSDRIQNRVCADPHWQDAKMVALYVATRNEVSTEMLLDAAWNNDKLVLLPRCLPPEQGAGRMEFALCRGRNELVPGAFGLSEPGPQCPVWCAHEPHVQATPPSPIDSGIFMRYPDIILVPAVGLSPAGARIGYGKGYYDRFLARPGWNTVCRVALVYSFQVVPFFSGSLDVPMHGYLTEKENRWL